MIVYANKYLYYFEGFDLKERAYPEAKNEIFWNFMKKGQSKTEKAFNLKGCANNLLFTSWQKLQDLFIRSKVEMSLNLQR